MKAIFLLLAVSLAANVVLGWMLWQHQHPAADTEPALVQQAAASDEVTLPLPTGSTPLTTPPFLPLPDTEITVPDRPPIEESRSGRLAPPDEEAYAPPLPPNRHAYPPWPQRVPYHKPQVERALVVQPR